MILAVDQQALPCASETRREALEERRIMPRPAGRTVLVWGILAALLLLGGVDRMLSARHSGPPSAIAAGAGAVAPAAGAALTQGAAAVSRIVRDFGAVNRQILRAALTEQQYADACQSLADRDDALRRRLTGVPMTGRYAARRAELLGALDALGTLLYTSTGSATVVSDAELLREVAAHLAAAAAIELPGATARPARPPLLHFALARDPFTSRPAQATLSGGRTAPCPPSGPSLLAILSAHVRANTARFTPPYPAGCLWLPIKVFSPTMAAQFSGATVVVTATFPDHTQVAMTNTLNSQGHAVDVLAMPFQPRPTDRAPGHRGAAAVVTLAGLITDRRGVAQPPISARVVVVPPHPQPTRRCPGATAELWCW
jgi:hypothetical protein